MKLNDLKAGQHIVEFRDGGSYIVLKGGDGLFLCGAESACGSLDGYDQSMLSVYARAHDICKVYSVVYCEFGFCLKDSCSKVPIWERDQEKEELESKIRELQEKVERLRSRNPFFTTGWNCKCKCI